MDWRRSIARGVGGLRGVDLRTLRSTVVGGTVVPRYCQGGRRRHALLCPSLTTRSSRSEEGAGDETPAQPAQQDHSASIEAELALPYDDEQDENFSTNELEDTFVSLAQAPPQFAGQLRYQLVQQLLTTDIWLFIKEPAVQEHQQAPQSANESRAIQDTSEESFSVVELDLEHSKRPCIPAFTSESRAEEAMQAAKSEKSFEAIGVQGLMLMQELNKEAVPKDVLLNPFSRYGKRIAWEEVQWLAAHGRRLLKRAARPESDTSMPSTSKTIDVPEVVENPVRDPFKVFNIERK